MKSSLTEAEVREILIATTDPMKSTAGWSKYVGHGRLNAFAAMRAARRR